MLHHVTVRNFAYFKDEQTLNFDKNVGGHYLLIGENDSGKSSLFEIIRGCMGASKCTSLPKPHDKSEPSIAVCCFRVSTGEYGGNEAVSALIRLRTDKECEDMYIKLIHVGPNKKQFEIEYTVSKADEASGINLKWEYMKQSESQKLLLKLREKEKWHEHVDHILGVVSEHLKPETLKKSSESGDAEKLNGCERLLKMCINKNTVVTFPMTGISTCQWTKSKLLKQDRKPSAVQEEIVTWYLKKLDAKHANTSSGASHDSQVEGSQAGSVISDEEERKERDYFNLITNNIGFEFSYYRPSGTITVTNQAFRDNVSKFQQTPEGIYEAKKLSVLLAVEKFQTVCLEEPDRGMHHQMIGRIRDLVLPQLKDKVVLITSHSPSFLSPTTIPKVFYFRRHIERELCTSTIVPLWLQNEEYEKDNAGKTGRIITSGQSPLLFFASNLLLVEGEGDYIFATALKQLLLTDDDTLQHYIDLRGNTTRDKMKIFLCSLHIIPMIGEANKIRYRRFCKRLGKESFFLMDLDALTNNIPEINKEKNGLKNFLEWFEIERAHEEVSKDVRVLEEDGLFIWKGTIETAIASFAQKHELKTFLRKNNVHLRYKDAGTGKDHDGTKRAGLDSRQSNSSTDTDASTHDDDDSVKSRAESADNRDTGARRRAGKQGKKKKKPGKREKKKKIFSHKELTNENIRKVVEKIVTVSKDDDESEIRRLIMFLIKISVARGLEITI